MDTELTSASTAPSNAEVFAWLQLGCAKLSPRNLMKLLAAFDGPEAVIDACKHSSTPLARFEKQLRAAVPVTETALEWAQADNHHLLVRSDPAYPVLLTEIADPPAVLFITGNPAVLSQQQLAVVGSRKATTPARQLTREWAKELSSKGLVITSGLAYGIDAEAHYGCLQAGGKSIAVVATGPDICYPSRHRDLAKEIEHNGAIVSEFPPGVAPLPRHFPQRNRLISGLAVATLVMEAGIRSGSLVTARHALEQNRDVFCMPGSVRNTLAAGCHQLIRDGAQLVSEADHILAEFGIAPWQPPSGSATKQKSNSDRDTMDAAAPTEADKTSDALLRHAGFDPFTPDSLCQLLDSDIQTIVLKLQELELDGVLTSLGDGRYQRCR